MNETEEMMDRIIKEADDYLKGTLQQSFTNKENKQNILYKILNNGQNPNKILEFQRSFGSNEIIPNLKETNKNSKENNNNNINNIQNNYKNENNIVKNNKKIKENNNIF